MPAAPVSTAALQRAIAAVKGGASLADAAEEGGISLATLKRYRAGQGSRKAAAPKPKASGASSTVPPKVTRRPGRVVAPTPPPDPPSAAAEGDDEPVLVTLGRELRYARKARKEATAEDQPGAAAKWSKRIEELVKVIDRLAPAPPPPPDHLLEELRRLDAEAIMLIEQHLPDPIVAEEIAA